MAGSTLRGLIFAVNQRSIKLNSQNKHAYIMCTYCHACIYCKDYSYRAPISVKLELP